MAQSITISQADLVAADAFLTTFMNNRIPEGDFSLGSAERDFVITAIASLYAFIRQEQATTRAMQSLKTVQTLPPSENVDEAVNAIISNLFIKRKTGAQTQLTVTLHFSRAVDCLVPGAARWNRTAALAYYPPNNDDIMFSAIDMKPTFAGDGSVIDYTIQLTLSAAAVGTEYNVAPGRFSSVPTISPYLLYAENTALGVDGVAVETTEAVLARAPTALVVRNLVSERSIDTVLRDNYPTLTDVLTVGMGEPEMVRDLVDEGATRLHLHVGGCVDVYVGLPRTTVTEALTIGGLYARPDNQVNILRDAAGFAGVLPGHVLLITSGLPDAPREYIVVRTGSDYLVVHPRTQFSQATDENDPPTTVTYSVGTLAPTFNDVIAQVTTGATSRKLQVAGSVFLLGRPHYKITSMAVDNGFGVLTQLPTRINHLVGFGAAEYGVVEQVPYYAQSGKAVTEIRVDPGRYNGELLRIAYDTLVGYDAVSLRVSGPGDRIVVASTLVKGYHPVYLGGVIAYQLKRTATVTTLNPVAVATAAATYVNTFSPIERIDRTGLYAAVRAAFPDISVIFAENSVTYDLLAPDGQVYSYATEDVVSVFPQYLVNSAQLTNGVLLADPIANADLDPSVIANTARVAVANSLLAGQLALLGLSDRNVRYYANPTDFTIVQRP